VTLATTFFEWAGIVAAGAAVVALLAVYVGLVLRWLTYRRLLIEAAYEAAHNLQHFGQAHDPDADCFKAWPDLSVDRAIELLDPSLLRWTTRHSDVYGDLDHMVRNHVYIARHPFDDTGLAAATDFLEYYAEHALRLLVHAAHFRGVRKLLEELKLEWLGGHRAPHIRFRWKQAVTDRGEGKYRTTSETPLIAWMGSPDIHRPSLGPLFEAMEDPPPEGRRPRLPRY
jgi:hypothetical protein